MKLQLAPVILGLITAAMTGCGSSDVSKSKSSGSSGNTTPAAATSVYVVQRGSGTILQFGSSSNGNVSPVSSLLNSNAYTVATDPSGQLYVGDAVDNSISVYPAGSTGSASPIRTISGAGVVLIPQLLAADSTGSVYVSDGLSCKCVAVFSNDEDSAGIPARFLQGSLTQIVNPSAIAIDTAGYLYVAEALGHGLFGVEGQIEVFAPGATGNVAPMRLITGTVTAPIEPTGLAVDKEGHLYVNQGGVQILEFAAGANGDPTPIRQFDPPLAINVIAGGLTVSSALQVDSIDNLYVLIVSTNSGTVSGNVAVYSASATGAATPTSTFHSPGWNSPGTSLALR